jgi:hypothetical protein
MERNKKQSILHTQNDLSKMAGFIETPRLILRRVFPYTRQRDPTPAFDWLARRC